MPWLDVKEPFSAAPRAVGPLTAPTDGGAVDLDDRWGSILEAELRGGVDISECEQVDVRGSVFHGVTFRARPGVEFDVTGSTFVDCDLSALRFTKLTNTSFEGCKLSGIDFSSGLVRDVIFDRAVLRLAVIRMAEFERVEFRDSLLDDVDAYEATLTDVAVPGTALRAVDLDQVRFRSVDLRDATELDLRSCRRFEGCLLTEAQVIPLARLFADAAGVSIAVPLAQEEARAGH